MSSFPLTNPIRSRTAHSKVRSGPEAGTGKPDLHLSTHEFKKVVTKLEQAENKHGDLSQPKPISFPCIYAGILPQCSVINFGEREPKTQLLYMWHEIWERCMLKIFSSESPWLPKSSAQFNPEVTDMQMSTLQWLPPGINSLELEI